MIQLWDNNFAVTPMFETEEDEFADLTNKPMKAETFSDKENAIKYAIKMSKRM